MNDVMLWILIAAIFLVVATIELVLRFVRGASALRAFEGLDGVEGEVHVERAGHARVDGVDEFPADTGQGFASSRLLKLSQICVDLR